MQNYNFFHQKRQIMSEKQWIITFFDYFCTNMKQISILIPTYNSICVELVHSLQQQAELLAIDYEIIVADDGSTAQDCLQANRAIRQLPHCQFMEREQNAGRAAIRNFLAQQAQYEWLLLIDCDMVVCRKDFLMRYAENAHRAQVIDGGVVINRATPDNLRARYEKAAEPLHTAERRQRTPYQHLHTANLLIRRDVLLQHPFDERFRRYGYEDVLLGRQLEEAHVEVLHIDNPLSFEVFESNEHFVSKTEEGLRTLHQFQQELRGYSNLLTVADKLRPIAPLVRLWHAINKRWERRLLTGSHPSLKIFSLYRLGYFMSLS
jgi:glycosyltransferase involved in cell wall biosynthesis